MFDAREFWNNVDKNNPYKSIGELIRAGSMNYHRITQQRVDGIIPKAEDLLKLSTAMHKSIEFLLTGKDFIRYSPRVEAIARHCQYFASDEDLYIVEKILKIDSEYQIVQKESKGKNHSANALA